MLRLVLRTVAWSGAACLGTLLLFAALILWPDPLFAYSASDGRIVIKSDRPIPAAAGDRLLGDCEALLARSPMKAEATQYRLYVTNERWRQRLFFLINGDAHGLAYPGGNVFLSGADFDNNLMIHNGYVPQPPRTLTYYCAHEITHTVSREHGFNEFQTPIWVFEGFPDYVGIEKRQSFEELRRVLGDRPTDIPMMVRYGGYPRHRLLVTYFLEKKGWTVEQLFQTRMTEEEANAVMRTDNPG